MQNWQCCRGQFLSFSVQMLCPLNACRKNMDISEYPGNIPVMAVELHSMTVELHVNYIPNFSPALANF